MPCWAAVEGPNIDLNSDRAKTYQRPVRSFEFTRHKNMPKNKRRRWKAETELKRDGILLISTT